MEKKEKEEEKRMTKSKNDSNKTEIGDKKRELTDSRTLTFERIHSHGVHAWEK